MAISLFIIHQLTPHFYMDTLNLADKTLHCLAQLIALTGMQCLLQQADDSQTNMAWNYGLHWLEGRVFNAQQHERAAIGAGYAIADSICPEPYFYLSGYHKRQPINFLNAPSLSAGEWRTGADWQGALLPISASLTPDRIDAFFRESYTWLHKLINE